MTRARTIADFGDGIATADIGDGQITTAKMFSGFANGITMAEEWRLTTNQSASGTATNLEVADETTSGSIGTGMSVSSGIFTFPETGIYWIIANIKVESSADDNMGVNIDISTDSGSTYNTAAEGFDSGNGGSAGAGQASTSYIINVQDVSTTRVKFNLFSIVSGSVAGDTNANKTVFTFIRLGDS